MLLDRAADMFLAHRADADGWLIKPLDAFRLRRAAQTLHGRGRVPRGQPDGDGRRRASNHGHPRPGHPREPGRPEVPPGVAAQTTAATTVADDTVATEAENAEAAEA